MRHCESELLRESSPFNVILSKSFKLTAFKYLFYPLLNLKGLIFLSSVFKYIIK